MGWVKHYDERLDHLKLLEAGPLATHLDDMAILWCNRNLTDGFIPARQVRRLVDWEGVLVSEGGKPKPVDPMLLAERLVGVCRWVRSGDGFHIHDYLETQQSSEQILDRRAKDSLRKAKGNPHRSPSRSPNGIHAESTREAA